MSMSVDSRGVGVVRVWRGLIPSWRLVVADRLVRSTGRCRCSRGGVLATRKGVTSAGGHGKAMATRQLAGFFSAVSIMPSARR